MAPERRQSLALGIHWNAQWDGIWDKIKFKVRLVGINPAFGDRRKLLRVGDSVSLRDRCQQG